MADPIKIRAVQQGDFTEIKVLLQHPMENGMRHDLKSGALLPAHFIQTFSLAVNGKTMIQANLNTAVSANPVMVFRLQGIKAGDKVNAAWKDNRGDSRSDEALVIQA